jgi:hypothetical protein
MSKSSFAVGVAAIVLMLAAVVLSANAPKPTQTDSGTVCAEAVRPGRSC